MLMLDHKYRELKGSLIKGDTKKLAEELKLPVTEKSLPRLQNPAQKCVKSEEVGINLISRN